MSSTFSAPPHLNGNNAAVSPEVMRESTFIGSVLRLRDDVYSGKHPSIKLPPHVLEKVAPRPSQHTAPINKQPITNGTHNGAASHQQLPPRPESLPQQHHASASREYNSSPRHAQRSLPIKPTTSGIDPVLLTKSDHLIRAELVLKRQHIERALKDQVDRRARLNDTLAEDREALDVEAILTKAQDLVKPVSGLPSAPSSPRSESFDENSYYSSKAHSWSSEEVDSKTQTADPVAKLTSQANDADPAPEPTLTAVIPEPRAVVRQPDNINVIDLDEEPYEPADDIEIYEPEAAIIGDEQEESDYSPPPAEVGSSTTRRGHGRNRGYEGNGSANGSSRRQSPTGNPAPIVNSRKRRREEKRKQQQSNKRVVRSPEPYIKEEPQSPPPFASFSDSQPSKRRALQPLPHDLELTPGRDGRMQPVYYREQDHSPRSLRQVEEPSSPTVVRIPQRRIERDEQDLRRVASLQYARRPYSPTGAGAYPAVEARPIRAISHAPIERPVEHVYREASARPSAAPRYVRERSRSPGHEYFSRPQSPLIRAPPPRKIVVDQYGNKYYAAPIDVRESVAPPSRRVELEPYYERAVTREPMMRVPVQHEVYDEEDMQRMPPPPPRRFVEAPETEVLETRPYRQREASYRPAEIEYAPREVVERRPTIQYEEVALPREHATRAYSMRPEPIRREVGEFAPVRHESVQPGYVRVAAAPPRYREVSIVQEPFDDRRYAYAAPTRRYVENGAIDRPIEVPQEVYATEPRRASNRY